MPLIQQRRVQDPDRPGYAVFRRRPRAVFLVLALLAWVALLGFGVYYLSPSLLSVATGEGEQAEAPAEEPAGAPVEEEAPEEPAGDGEDGDEEEPAGADTPRDPRMYLTVPKLGIYDHTVRNDRSEEAQAQGAIKLPNSGFPWQSGDINTYVSCHRLGFPGNESFNQCLNLPLMQQGDEITLRDSEGTTYTYRVSEFLNVLPEDTWVTRPVEGRDVISLQTCLESSNDFYTLGPDWAARYIVRADKVA